MEKITNTIKGAWNESKILTLWTAGVVLFWAVWFSTGFYGKIANTEFYRNCCEAGVTTNELK